MTNHPTGDQPTGARTGRLRRAWSTLVRSNTNPTDRPGPDAPRFVDWSGLAPRVERLRETSDRAVQLATTYQPTTRPAKAKRSTDRLRYIPPVAALGTAFVLQTVAVTDAVGGALARALVGSDVQWLSHHPGVGYLAGLLLGIAVASCAEGGAAYLMDLYDKHLLARDSVWILRLAMAGYVGVSAAAIHWWTTYRHLPTVTSWLLAGMSASALFLWSRGSRWRNRVAMRAAGQLDPALPKLPAQAKLLHPVRWLVTLYLVSWEPAATTDEARARYESWRAARVDRRAATKATKAVKPTSEPAHPKPTNLLEADTTTAAVVAEEAPVDVGRSATADPSDPPAIVTATTRPAVRRPTTKAKPTARPLALVHGPTAVADAAFLRSTYGDSVPGRNELHRTHGGNAERWSKALKALADGADQQPTARPSDLATAAGGTR